MYLTEFFYHSKDNKNYCTLKILQPILNSLYLSRQLYFFLHQKMRLGMNCFNLQIISIIHFLISFPYSYFFFSRFYLFIFRERGKEGERAGEKHQCVAASHMPPSGDLAHNLGICPGWESNWQPFSQQAGTQSTEPHQPGSYLCLHQIDH